MQRQADIWETLYSSADAYLREGGGGVGGELGRERTARYYKQRTTRLTLDFPVPNKP